jgi:uncharacterized membrane protein
VKRRFCFRFSCSSGEVYGYLGKSRTVESSQPGLASSTRLACLVCALVVSIVVFASLSGPPAYAGKTASIDRLEITARLAPDASLAVSEQTTWSFSGGDFSRVSRKLDLLPDQRLESLSVWEETAQGRHEYVRGTLGVRAAGTYAVGKEKNSYTIEVYFAASSPSRRTFVIDFVVSGAAKVYRDVADLQWTWVGKENSARIEQLRATVEVPDSTVAESDFRVWGHGPLSGRVTKISNNKAAWEASDIPPGTLVDGRVVLPASVLGSAPTIPEEKLPEILQEEAKAARKANLSRLAERLRLGLGFGGLVLSAALWLFLFFRYGREYEPTTKPIYERDLPARYSPAIVGYLMNNGTTHPSDVTAVLMDLVRRGFIELRPAGTYDPGIFERERPDYAFVWKGLPKEQGDHLRPYEAQLVGFLFGSVPPVVSSAPPSLGSEQPPSQPEASQTIPTEAAPVSVLPTEAASPTDPASSGIVGQATVSTKLSLLEERAKTNKAETRRFFESFRKAVESEASFYGLFEKSGEAAAAIALLLGIATAIGGFLVLPGVAKLAAVVVGVLEAMGSPLMSRRSRRGRNQYERWRAFSRFLGDFSIMRERLPTELPLWERYMVYAIPLGQAERVLDQLPFYLPPEHQEALARSYGLYYGGKAGLGGAVSPEGTGGLFKDFVTNFTSSFTTAMSSAASASGAGGGFSSGGGRGGGGGGYSAD